MKTSHEREGGPTMEHEMLMAVKQSNFPTNGNLNEEIIKHE
jgi:hypothetical protein